MRVRHFPGLLAAVDRQIAYFQLQMKGDGVKAAQFYPPAGHLFQHGNHALGGPDSRKESVVLYQPRPTSTNRPASSNHSRTSKSCAAPASRRFHSLCPAPGRRHQRLRADLASRPQVLQPGGEQLSDFLLGKEFLDFPGNFSQRNTLPARLVKLRQKLLLVIALDALCCRY